LKIYGIVEYVWGKNQIIDFCHIRKCLSRHKIPHLQVCEKPDSTLDFPKKESDPWNYADESTGVTQSHNQLTIKDNNKNHSEVVAFSLWDMEQRLRLKIIGVDYLTICDEIDEKPEEVYVEASVYQGTQKLTATVSTAKVPFNNCLR